MNARSRSVPGTEAAQAFAVGAILITGIVLTATFLYLSINEPIVTKESEYQHAADVAADFSALCSSITALGESASTGASLSVPIRTCPTKESLIARLKESSGTISFSPTTEQVTVSVTDNGTGASPGVWTDEDFENTTHTIGVKVNTSSGTVTLAGSLYTQGYVESNLSNAMGHIGYDTGSASTVYENLTWNTSLPGDTRIVLKVRTDMFPNMTHARNWSACTPIESRNNGFNTQDLSEISSVSLGHQYVQYRAELSTWDPSLTPTLFNVSISYNCSHPEVVLARSSGAISFTSNYFYLPNHALMYEDGAVIKSQPEGDFTLVNSGISATKDNSTGIRISLFDLAGPPVPPPELVYSGPSTTLITVYREDYELISDPFYYPNLTLNIATKYTQAWSSWLNKTLDAAGLVRGSDYDPVNITDDSVRVVFHDQDGIKLYLDKTTVQVRISRPG
jgi:hypothetical protein